MRNARRTVRRSVALAVTESAGVSGLAGLHRAGGLLLSLLLLELLNRCLLALALARGRDRGDDGDRASNDVLRFQTRDRRRQELDALVVDLDALVRPRALELQPEVRHLLLGVAGIERDRDEEPGHRHGHFLRECLRCKQRRRCGDDAYRDMLTHRMPLLREGKRRVSVNVLHALSTRAAWPWSAETGACDAPRHHGRAPDPEELLLLGFFLEQLGARLDRVLELRLGNEEHVLGELFLARQALAQLLQPLGVGPRGFRRRRA